MDLLDPIFESHRKMHLMKARAWGFSPGGTRLSGLVVVQKNLCCDVFGPKVGSAEPPCSIGTLR